MVLYPLGLLKNVKEVTGYPTVKAEFELSSRKLVLSSNYLTA